MRSILPTGEQITALRECADEGAFVMLNLIKLKEEGKGEEAYGRYLAQTAPLLARVGGRLLWMGEARQQFIGAADENADRVLLVEYPSRRAFLEMIAMPEYEAIHANREEGIEGSVLLACRTLYGPQRGPA